MARLIDADALKEEVEFQQEHMWPEDLSYRIPKMIDEQPTIYAIPVEWLRKWPKDLREGAYVRDILRDWQKEQEAR